MNLHPLENEQAEKLKSREKRKDEWRMMKDDDFKQLRGFGNGQRNGQTDISECRIAFATEN